MRYFLTKLTFNNHFFWLYAGNRKFCDFMSKNWVLLEINEVGNILSIVTFFSLLWRLKLYISVLV